LAVWLEKRRVGRKTAVTGREGLIGIPHCMDVATPALRAVVQYRGYGYRFRAAALKAEFERGGALQHILLRYTRALVAQTGQVVVCNRFHSVEQQLCRWLLSCLDRLSADDLTITHELIASNLGVRREAITQAAIRLQRLGLISYCRGHLTVLDRSQLEARACECYAAIKREYGRPLSIPERRRRAPNNSHLGARPQNCDPSPARAQRGAAVTTRAAIP
jgi:Crp-like helix-turn-helix domain